MSFGTDFVSESDTEIVPLFCLTSFNCLEPGIRDWFPFLTSSAVQTGLCSLCDVFFRLLFTQVQSSCVWTPHLVLCSRLNAVWLQQSTVGLLPPCSPNWLWFKGSRRPWSSLQLHHTDHPFRAHKPMTNLSFSLTKYDHWPGYTWNLSWPDFLDFFFSPLCWDCPNLRSRYTRVKSTNKAHGFPLQCPLPVRVPSSLSLLIQLSPSSCIFIFPWGRHKAWSHGFLKSRHASSVAFPLPTRLPTLSREEMKLVVHILFWSTPTFSDSIVICSKRNNWVFIKKKKMTVSLKPNFEQMREMTF